MRFLGHMRGSADERELMLSLIQAGAVWYDLDARIYRRELNGRFTLEVWLPGADVTNDPREIDVDAVLTPDAPTHISSINDLEQHGWQSVQGEVLLLPIAATSLVRRVLVVAGPVEREVEATMMVVCRSAGSVLDQLAEKRGHEVRDRLARRIATATNAFGPSLRAVVDEYVRIVDAAAARVVMTRAELPAVRIYSTGGQMWTSEEAPRLAPGAIELSTRRIAIGFALRKGTAGAVELLAPPDRPFTVERAEAAVVGADVLAVWLAGHVAGHRAEAGRRPPTGARGAAVRRDDAQGAGQGGAPEPERRPGRGERAGGDRPGPARGVDPDSHRARRAQIGGPDGAVGRRRRRRRSGAYGP